jgi:hypothetical protein
MAWHTFALEPILTTVAILLTASAYSGAPQDGRHQLLGVGRDNFRAEAPTIPS